MVRASPPASRLARVRRTLAIAAAAPLLWAAPAQAWGDEGHRVVALIAESLLTPSARAGIKTILDADNDGMTEPDFASRATWADKLRTKIPSTGPWHYANLNVYRPDVAAACRHEGGCILTTINSSIRVLSDHRITGVRQAFALKMLVHLIGDLHQPLHVADAGDGGGNCELIVPKKASRFSFGSFGSISLHHYWDTEVVEQIDGSAPRLAATLTQSLTKADAAAWSRGVPQSWAGETFIVARDHAYRYGGLLTCDKAAKPTELTAAYQSSAQSIAKVQLTKAGVRLAGILNSLFPAARR